MPAFIGEMISVTVRNLADEPVITQEAQVTADAGGKLFVCSPGTQRSGRKLLTQDSIGNTGDRETGVADGLKKLPIFAANVQRTNPTAIFDVATKMTSAVLQVRTQSGFLRK